MLKKRHAAGSKNMRKFVQRLWSEQEGVLSFEWTLLVVLLVVGIVSGVAAARDVIIDELGDAAEALLAFDQSYSFAGIPLLGIPASQYTDTMVVVGECGRGGVPGQLPINDADNGA
jgi:Flp pilus assembly pilin Flp